MYHIKLMKRTGDYYTLDFESKDLIDCPPHVITDASGFTFRHIDSKAHGDSVTLIYHQCEQAALKDLLARVEAV